MRLGRLIVLSILVAPHASAQLPAATLTGVVYIDSGTSPLAGVGVAIPALRKASSTDDQGRFRIDDVKPGAYEVVARRVGFAPSRTWITFQAGRTVEDTIRLAAVIALDLIKVTAAGAIPSFEEHRALGLGSFLTRDELERYRSRRLSDVVSQLRGAAVLSGKGNNGWLYSRRGVRSLNSRTCGVSRGNSNIGLDPADVAMGAKPCTCYAQVYLDRALVYRGSLHGGESLFNLNSLSVDQVEAVEYFAGASQTPLEYSTLNSTCGVLVIHTRRSY
jgi:hypothetical protein